MAARSNFWLAALRHPKHEHSRTPARPAAHFSHPPGVKMSLLDLSAELILSIASHVRQADLPNISLVCKHLKVITEPELYREYTNFGLRLFAPFIKRLISDERFTRYVKKIDLRYWETLEKFNPIDHEPI
jgi:hypothetical protein